MKKTLKDGFVLLKNDIKNAGWAIMIIIAYFVFGGKVLQSVCPLVWLTGFPCPACGLTRAGISLLHLDFKGAWEMHPFIYVIVFVGCIFAWKRYICREKTGKYWKRILIGIVMCMVLFYIWRMYYFFPETAPMTYNPNNFIRMIGIAFRTVK